MTLLLERFAYSPMGTFGLLSMGPWACYTVERPWDANRPFVSCIPDGVYPLRPSRFDRGGYDTLEVADVPGRSSILIHRGNVADDVQGCIAIGRALGVIGGRWAVLDSRGAWAEFADLVLSDAPSAIVIRHCIGAQLGGDA